MVRGINGVGGEEFFWRFVLVSYNGSYRVVGFLEGRAEGRSSSSG